MFVALCRVFQKWRVPQTFVRKRLSLDAWSLSYQPSYSGSKMIKCDVKASPQEKRLCTDCWFRLRRRLLWQQKCTRSAQNIVRMLPQNVLPF